MGLFFLSKNFGCPLPQLFHQYSIPIFILIDLLSGQVGGGGTRNFQTVLFRTSASIAQGGASHIVSLQKVLQFISWLTNPLPFLEPEDEFQCKDTEKKMLYVTKSILYAEWTLQQLRSSLIRLCCFIDTAKQCNINYISCGLRDKIFC